MHMFNNGLSLHLKSLLICLVNYKSKKQVYFTATATYASPLWCIKKQKPELKT